jgi:hypothetical protein
MPDQADQGQTGRNAERGLRIAKYDAAKDPEGKWTHLPGADGLSARNASHYLRLLPKKTLAE